MIVLFAAVAIVVVESKSQQSAPKSTDATKDEPAQSAKGQRNSQSPAAAPAPPITVVVQAPPEDPAAHARQEQRDQSNTDAQKRMADLTTVLVILGGLTLLFIGWQAWETRKAANAAKMSAEAAEVALVISERSYLDIGDFNLAGILDTQTNLLYRFRVTGRTPVTILDGIIRMSIDGPIEMKPHLDSRLIQPVNPQALTHLMWPYQIVSFPVGVGEDNIAAWSAAKTTIHFGGHIRYRDAFPKTPVHVRHFSYACIGPDGKFVLNTPGGIVSANYEEDEKEG
jgi:hypothetical protein